MAIKCDVHSVWLATPPQPKQKYAHKVTRKVGIITSLRSEDAPHTPRIKLIAVYVMRPAEGEFLQKFDL